MECATKFQVTLSGDLLTHLRKTAQEIHVPLRWLVAGLVCDTIEADAEQRHQADPVRLSSSIDGKAAVASGRALVSPF